MSDRDYYKIKALELFLEYETLTSNVNFLGINPNQYFCEIKTAGIELVEIRVKNKNNDGFHKERTLLKSKKNIIKAPVIKKHINISILIQEAAIKNKGVVSNINGAIKLYFSPKYFFENIDAIIKVKTAGIKETKVPITPKL